jgi:hypothetical protein
MRSCDGWLEKRFAQSPDYAVRLPRAQLRSLRSNLRRRQAAVLVRRPCDLQTVRAESDALLTCRVSATMLGWRQVSLRLLGRQQQDRNSRS